MSYLKILLVLTVAAVIGGVLLKWMTARNIAVQAFSETVFAKVKLVVISVITVFALGAAYYVHYINAENDKLKETVAIQEVSIQTGIESKKVDDATAKNNEATNLALDASDKGIVKGQKVIDDKRVKDEGKIASSSLTPAEKQEALSATRIDSLWDTYNAGMSHKGTDV